MTPPDSGEREVRLQMAIAVLSEIVNPPPTVAGADGPTQARWMQGCARHALVKLSDAAQPDFSLLPRSLAQRILAALEGHFHIDDCPTCSHLVRELRARMPK